MTTKLLRFVPIWLTFDQNQNHSQNSLSFQRINYFFIHSQFNGNLHNSKNVLNITLEWAIAILHLKIIILFLDPSEAPY